MLTVYQYGDIRRAYRDGMSIRVIATTFHHSRRKVREAELRITNERHVRIATEGALLGGPAVIKA